MTFFELSAKTPYILVPALVESAARALKKCDLQLLENDLFQFALSLLAFSSPKHHYLLGFLYFLCVWYYQNLASLFIILRYYGPDR